MRQGHQSGFTRLVGNPGIVLDCSNRRDRDNYTTALGAHNGQGVFAGKDNAAQIDRDDTVKGFGRDLSDRRVAAGHTDTDVVVENIESPEMFFTVVDCCFKAGLVYDIGGNSLSLPTFTLYKFYSFLCRINVAVYGEYLGPLACE